MKIIYTLLFACMFICLPEIIVAQNFSVNNISYKVISAEKVAVISANEKYKGTVNIPSSVTNAGTTYSVVAIDVNAFLECTELNKVTFPQTLTGIGNSAFQGCTALELPVFPEGLKRIGKSAFYRCTGFAGTLILPNSVDTIGNNSFFRCSNLTDALVLPSSLKWLESNAFLYCTGFNGAIVLPDSITYIGASPFAVCPGIMNATETLTLPESVRHIDGGAFQAFTNLKTINFNAKNCNILGNDTTGYAFVGCNSVETINIGANVTRIPQYGFASLASVEYIKSNAITPPQTSDKTFLNVPVNIPISVPCNATGYTTATNWKNFTNIQMVGSTDIPYNLTANDDAAGIKLQWKGNAANYQIFRDNTLLQTVNQTTYIDNSTTFENIYCYQIRVANTNAGCADAISNEVCMNYTAINNVETKHFKIYPLPASDKIFIEGDVDYSNIKIYDIFGREVLNSDKTDELNISNLPDGNYLINILNKEISIERIKIFKN